MAFEPLQTIELTPEEQSAASAFIRSLMEPGKEMIARERIAEELKRGFIALAIFSLADRLTTSRRATGDTPSAERGCVAAIKAFALYPIAVNCYECARILAGAGRSADARPLFQEFLRLCDAEPSGEVRDLFTARHNIDDLRNAALRYLSKGIVPAI
jgi:hypothetical protein